MSVITLSFIMNKVPSGQQGKFQINILIYSPCSISYRSLHLYFFIVISLISLFFLLRPVTALLQKSLHPGLLTQFSV